MNQIKTEEEKLFRRLTIVFILGIIVTITYFLVSGTDCESVECFNNEMISCSKAEYINEEPEASWRYEIKGERDDQCRIEVTLLNAKQGTLGINELEGEMMECLYPLGVADFPEKNLDLCHGRLKESLQERIIVQLHEYILGNLGEINEEISAF